MAAKRRIKETKGIKVLDLTPDSLKGLSADEMRLIGGAACLPFAREINQVLGRLFGWDVNSCGKLGDQCTILQEWRPKYTLLSGTTLIG